MALRAHGLITCDLGRYIDIARSHPSLKRFFANSPYGGDWATVLRRISGAESTDKRSFGSRDSKSRAIRVPLQS